MKNALLRAIRDARKAFRDVLAPELPVDHKVDADKGEFAKWEGTEESLAAIRHVLGQRANVITTDGVCLLHIESTIDANLVPIPLGWYVHRMADHTVWVRNEKAMRSKAAKGESVQIAGRVQEADGVADESFFDFI